MCPSVNAMSRVVKKEVVRNVLCPYYNTCLNHAVAKNLPQWDCSTCEHKHKKEKIDPAEAERCGNLLYRIFSETHQENDFHNVKMKRFDAFSVVTARKWLKMIASRNSKPQAKS